MFQHIFLSFHFRYLCTWLD